MTNAAAEQNSSATDATDSVLTLMDSLRDCTSPARRFRATLRVIAAHFDAPYALLQIDGTTTNLTDCTSGGSECETAWKRHCNAMLLSARQSATAKARLFEASAGSEVYAVLAVPVSDQNHGVIGALAVTTRCRSGEIAEAKLSELSTLMKAAAVFGDRAANASTAASEQPAASRSSAFGRLSGFESLHEFAFSLVNDLKSKTGIDQVALGLIRRRMPKLLCMSGFDNLYPRSPGSQVIEQAMAECCDAGRILCYQNDKAWAEDSANTGHHLHRAWHEACGNVPVASIPLMQGDTCLAVLSLRGPANMPFSQAQLQKIAQVVTPYAPALLLLERAGQSLARHAVDSLAHTARSLVHRGSWGRRGVAMIAVAAGCWMAFGTTDHMLSVPCEIVPAESVQMAAPFEGAVAEVHVRPGDQVEENQLLLTFETLPLENELRSAESELARARLELAHAAGANDLAAAGLADSEIRIAESKLATIRHKIARAEVRAPADGSVLSGDLQRRVGEVLPLGEPLLEFAGSDKWLVELRVPEFCAPHLQQNMSGSFTTNARPDESASFFLRQMNLTSQVIDGRNVFVAEGSILEETGAELRAGMQGVARVNAGRKPVWWVWLHGAIDTVRLQMWKW